MSKNINSNSKAAKPSPKVSSPKRKPLSIVKTRRYRRRPIRRAGAVPVAYGSANTSRMNFQVASNGSTVMYSTEIFPVERTDGVVDKMIPICPTKWGGTRTATFAQTFASYRPKFVRISWVPNAPTSLGASVTFGTVTDGASFRPSDRSQVATMLSATNGGIVTSIWKPVSTEVKLGTNLRANTFPTRNTSMDDIPFWVLCQVGTDDSTRGTQYGFLKLEVRWHLHNPTAIGNNLSYCEVEMDFSHDGTNNATTMHIKGANRNLVPDGNSQFVVSRNLPFVNATGPGIRILEPFTGHFLQRSANQVDFEVNNSIASYTPSAGRLFGYFLQQDEDINFTQAPSNLSRSASQPSSNRLLMTSPLKLDQYEETSEDKVSE